MQAIDEALLRDQPDVVVARPAAAHGVAGTVAEGRDAAAVQRQLRSLDEARAIFDFAEVPAFAEQRDVSPRGSIDGFLQLFHRRARLVPHQVESEGIDAIVAHPAHGGVDHQLRHHPMFGGGVRTTGRSSHAPLCIEPVVVAGHDAVEHRTRILAACVRVVVDHVHADVEADAVQRLHHRAELANARRAVVGVAGIAAFRRTEVQRVVAPVEAVPGLQRGNGRLGRFAGTATADVGRRAAALRHGCEIEHREQMHVGHSGLGQRAQMTHAGRFAFGKRQVLAATMFGNRPVADREIADVKFVNHLVGRRARTIRRRRVAPSRRLGRRGIKIAEPGPLRIGTEADRIRIDDAIAHPTDARHHDIDEIAIVTAAPVALVPPLPDAAARIASHWEDVAGRCARVGMQTDRDGVGRGRPEAQCRCGAVHGRGQRVPRCRFGKQRIEQGCGLRARGTLHATILVLVRQQPLRRQGFAEPRPIGRRHVQQQSVARPCESPRQRLGEVRVRRNEVDVAVMPAHLRLRIDLQPRGSGEIEAKTPLAGNACPAQPRRVQPDRTRISWQRGRFRLQNDRGVVDVACVAQHIVLGARDVRR